MEIILFGGYNHVIITNIFWDHDVGTPIKRNSITPGAKPQSIFSSSYYYRDSQSSSPRFFMFQSHIVLFYPCIHYILIKTLMTWIIEISEW